jgi:PhzF family phenazine biosynthesis protein
MAITKLYQVDAFSKTPFRGNPAAVCLLKQVMPDQWMLDLAREMNLSETAFILPESDGYRLRWFTPEVEMDLCGHATLASAHVLWKEENITTSQIKFSTRSGLLTIRRSNGMDNGLIEMDFPLKTSNPSLLSQHLSKALDLNTEFIEFDDDNFILEIEDEEQLYQIKPDFDLLKKAAPHLVIVTCPAKNDQPYDFVSRVFAPGVGVNEDPVTGSAHCYLAAYWQKRTGKSTFKAYQASRRGGELWLEIQRDRVRIKGEAVTVFRGELCV